MAMLGLVMAPSSAARTSDAETRTSLRTRASALAATLFATRAPLFFLSSDTDLAGLNDETLLDLGIDPARSRAGRADPLLRFIV